MSHVRRRRQVTGDFLGSNLDVVLVLAVAVGGLDFWDLKNLTKRKVVGGNMKN